MSAWRSCVVPLLAIAALHVAGLSLLATTALGGSAVTGSAGVWAGLTAYLLGVRHAFDVDHIGAIDNVTSRLTAAGERPHATGFFFSLGHATVVFVLTALVASGVGGIAAALTDERSALHALAAVWGPAVVGVSLIALALVNVRPLLHSASDRRESERPPARLLARASAYVERPRHLYALGLLFGLGLDTAGEIALLMVAGGTAAGGDWLPALLALPLLFAAGMTLFDMLNSTAMTQAYGWASTHPRRDRVYRRAVTSISIGVAAVVGVFSLLAAVGEAGVLAHGPRALPADPAVLGAAVTAALLGTWLVAAGGGRRRTRAAR